MVNVAHLEVAMLSLTPLLRELSSDDGLPLVSGNAVTVTPDKQVIAVNDVFAVRGLHHDVHVIALSVECAEDLSKPYA